MFERAKNCSDRKSIYMLFFGGCVLNVSVGFLIVVMDVFFYIAFFILRVYINRLI